MGGVKVAADGAYMAGLLVRLNAKEKILIRQDTILIRRGGLMYIRQILLYVG